MAETAGAKGTPLATEFQIGDAFTDIFGNTFRVTGHDKIAEKVWVLATDPKGRADFTRESLNAHPRLASEFTNYIFNEKDFRVFLREWNAQLTFKSIVSPADSDQYTIWDGDKRVHACASSDEVCAWLNDNAKGSEAKYYIHPPRSKPLTGTLRQQLDEARVAMEFAIEKHLDTSEYHSIADEPIAGVLDPEAIPEPYQQLIFREALENVMNRRNLKIWARGQAGKKHMLCYTADSPEEVQGPSSFCQIL
jgi:hypothetical protein